MPNFQFTHRPLDSLFVTNEQGKRNHPTKKYEHIHTGIDFRSPVGTAVYATHKGRIIQSSIIGGGGYTVGIHDEESGLITLYEHLKENTLIAKNTVISEDQARDGFQIAESGDSGGVDPHLHFEVLDGNQAVSLGGSTRPIHQWINITSGSLGIKSSAPRLNPRPYLATLADNLATEILGDGATEEQIKSLSSEIFSSEIDISDKVSLEVEGDHRDNQFTGNSKANIFSGMEGVDTYRIDLSSSSKDQIIDPDHTGKLILDGTEISSPDIFALADSIDGSDQNWRMTHAGVNYHLARIDDNNIRDDEGGNYYFWKMIRYFILLLTICFSSISNSFALSKTSQQELEKKEKELLEKYPQYIEKRSGAYTIKLKNGETKRLVNCELSVELFDLEEVCQYNESKLTAKIFDIIDSYLIFQKDLRGGYFFINLNNGKNDYFPIARFSHNKKYFVASLCNDEYYENTTIYKIHNNTFEEVFSFQCKPYSYKTTNRGVHIVNMKFLSWEDNNVNIVINYSDTRFLPKENDNVDAALKNYEKSYFRKNSTISFDKKINQWKLNN